MPNSKEESTVHADGQNIPMETAGPYREEVEQEVNAEIVGDDTPPPALRKGSLGAKETPSTLGANPKRTENSRPD